MDASTLWHAIGIVGGLIFYGRFYVQWIASERAGRSVMPIVFWYMSSIGSVVLMAYAVVTNSPLGALGQNFNMVVYGRNLLHVWREQGTLTRTRRRFVNITMILVGIVAVGLLVYVWLGEYHHVKDQPSEVSRGVWIWLAIGVVGQALFAARFLVQWLATERERRSVVPMSFWYLSVVASSLQAAAFLQREEWVFGIGMLATIVIYLRNIWLVRNDGVDQDKSKIPFLRLLLLFFFALALFAIPSAVKDLWRPDEPRYAEVAREMMASGDYLVPRVNGEVYREKPPLLFWLMTASSWPVGTVKAFTARIPSILSALIAVCLTFGVARRMFGERAGLWSAVVLATSFRFWWQSSIGQIDMVLTACMTLSLYSLWRWYEATERRWVWTLTFYCGAALGLFAKGPPALLIVGLGAVVFLWKQRRESRTLLLWLGLPLAIIPVLTWFLLARSAAGGEVSQEVSGTFTRQIVQRIFHGVTHPEAPWYYLVNLPVAFAPWSLFAPWTIIYAWRTRRESMAVRLILAWTIPALIFFHLVVEKRNVYLLPLFPGFAILTARGLLALVAEGRTTWLRTTALIWVPALAAAVLVPILLPELPVGIGWHKRFIPLIAVGVIALIWMVQLLRKRDWGRWPMTLGIQSAMLLFVAGLWIFPVMNVEKSAKGFCAPVRKLLRAGDVQVYNAGPVREEYLFYTSTLHDYVLEAPGAAALPPNKDEGPVDLHARLAREAMADACEVIPVKSDLEPSPEELAALEQARDAALAKTMPPGSDLAAYNASVEKEVREFFGTLSGEAPAVFMVRESDWRWILSYVDAPLSLTMLEKDDIGRRAMLLLSNEAGVNALRRAPPRQPRMTKVYR